MVIAEQGYHSMKRLDLLAKMGIKDGIMRRGGRGHPLSAKDHARNRAAGANPLRPLSACFGTLKRQLWLDAGYDTEGWLKTPHTSFLLCTALNLRRIWCSPRKAEPVSRAREAPKPTDPQLHSTQQPHQKIAHPHQKPKQKQGYATVSLTPFNDTAEST